MFELEGAVLAQVDQLLEDRICVLRVAVGGGPHHLVLGGVHLEAEVVGEGAVEQPERVREADVVRISSKRLPRPTPWVAVAHSPTPSRVRMAASSNGDGRKADAAWLWWCSAKSTSPL
jgi:hypothetical protein